MEKPPSISGLTPAQQQQFGDWYSERIHENAQKGQEALQQAGVVYLDPTFDKTFKWLTGSDNLDIARTIFDSMIFLTYKGLVTRSVNTIKSASRKLDAMTEQLKRLPNDLCEFQALSPDVTATLKLSGPSPSEADGRGDDIGAIVDECIETLNAKGRVNKKALIGKLKELKSQIDKFKNESEKGDIRAAADIVNRIGRLMIDIEMQRSRQAIIEARALQYGAIMLLSRHAQNLLPLALISICQWKNASGDIINDVFHIGIGQGSARSISISQVTINILEVNGAVGMNDDQRKSERKRIKNVFKASLRQRYPELIKEGESFKSLWVEDDRNDFAIKRRQLRTAYEVLCFLRLAPFTPQLGDMLIDKDPNLAKADQPVDQLQARIFNPIIRKAYNLMKTNNVSAPGAQEQYLGVWSEQARIEEMQQRTIDNLITSASLFKFVPNEQKKEVIGQWAKATFLRPENLGIRQATINQIKDRQDEFDADVVAILENEYRQAVQTMPATPSRRQKRDDFSTRESPERTKPVDTPSLDTKILDLTNKVADRLRTEYFSRNYFELEYVQTEISRNPDVLNAIVGKLESNHEYRDIPKERIENFKGVVDMFINAPKM